VRGSYLSRLRSTFGPKVATVLLGVRRAGKSSLAYLFIQELIRRGTLEPRDSLIVNFEDPRFPPTLSVTGDGTTHLQLIVYVSVAGNVTGTMLGYEV